MPKQLKAYLASPLGFSEIGRHYSETIYVPALQEAGVRPIDPWILTTDEEVNQVLSLPEGEERNRQLRELHALMGKRNRTGIDMADIVIAQLDGQELDSGTCSEIGYAVGRGKPVFGWRSDFRQNGEIGAIVNLQVQYFIESSGGEIHTDLASLVESARKFIGLYG